MDDALPDDGDARTPIGGAGDTALWRDARGRCFVTVREAPGRERVVDYVEFKHQRAAAARRLRDEAIAGAVAGALRALAALWRRWRGPLAAPVAARRPARAGRG